MVHRLFIALELPDSIREALAEIGPPMRRVRWLLPDQMHLTLAFLGNVDAEAQSALETKLAEIRIAPFVLPVVGVGTFGHSRPKVIWAGVGHGHPHLFALHKKVLDAALAAGLQTELRAFHPHITIARVDGASQASLKPFIQTHAESEFGIARLDHFTLFSSQLIAGGSRYHVENRWTLAA